MRIGIDASRAFVPNRTGTEEYSWRIIKHILALPEARKHTWVLYTRGVIPSEVEGSLRLAGAAVGMTIRRINMPFLWTQVGLAGRTWLDGLDVLWVPAHTLPVLRKPGLKTVVTIHGIEYEWLPAYENALQKWYLPWSTVYAVSSATKVIAVSEFTKRQLVERLGADERKIYDLIWKRAVASQTTPAVYEQTSVDVGAGPYGLRANGSKRIFDGWERVYDSKQRTANSEQQGADGDAVSRTPLAVSEKELPQLKEGEELKLLELLPSQHFTEPSARYTEATLIKKLEEEGIGRPSTYAPIISTIQERSYVSREGRALKPEDAGFIVNDLLVGYFPDVVDLSFTAKMEEGLDEIARGEKNWVELIRGFYRPFVQELEKAEENIDKSSITTIAETDEKCPESGHPLVIKFGRYGRFYSCTGFPECKYARPYIEKIGMNCPQCKEGEVIIKRTKRGKTFYGCSRYPECKWASWEDPRGKKNG